ncbi:uncharacterized protein LOC121376854 [Gigantopelta aegis]|uniref:uncharacterized protein LOC121376854 n=1 Tax=Gigantopelta aegis TaxID=1735272 RepID=UPI001B88C737|nr:uncharacterized protein LOC121376854 [Gigantopelta aegis]
MEITGKPKRVQFSISLPDYGNVSQLKGILKTKSTPLMFQSGVEEEEKVERVNILGKKRESVKMTDLQTGVYPGTSTTVLSSIEAVPNHEQNGPTKQSSQEYENPAFVEDEFDSKEDLKHLSDVVEQIIGESTSMDIHTDTHPFGRSTLSDRIFGDNTKKMAVESSVLVIWVLFAVCLVGMAGGIIFLAETYANRATNLTSTN